MVPEPDAGIALVESGRPADPSRTDDGTDAAIDIVVADGARHRQGHPLGTPGGLADDDDGDDNDDGRRTTSNADRIGSTNLWVGGRRSGRPPRCWEAFDAVLNVTENEYPALSRIHLTQSNSPYLDLLIKNE